MSVLLTKDGRRMCQVAAHVDENLKNAAKKAGINMSHVFNEALKGALEAKSPGEKNHEQ